MKKYDRQINLKITAKELNNLSSVAKLLGISKSQLIRNAITNIGKRKNRILIKDNKFKKELVYELRKIGNNINQIAYSLNYVLKAGLHNQLESTILDTEQKLEDIQNLLNKLEASIENRL